MKDSMPKRPRQHVQETESDKKLASVIPDKWVYRDDIPKDYGLDGEIEIFDGDLATGHKINVQLKSTDSTDHKDQHSLRLDASTYNYFKTQRYPVLIVKYLAKLDKLVYRWAHGRNFLEPKEDADSILLYFQESDVLTEEIFKKLRVDTKNYIALDERRLASPIKVAITSENPKIKPESLSLEFIKYGAQNSVHLITVDDLSYDAEIKIREDYVVIYVGGERATSSFDLNEKISQTPELLNHYINFGIARILSHFDYTRMSTSFLKTSYQHISYKENPDMLIEPLIILFRANLYDDFLSAFKWAFSFVEFQPVCTLFFFKLYESCNLDSPAEKNVIEQVFKYYIEYNSEHSKDSVDLGAAYYNLGNFYRSTSRHYEAVKHYNKARKLNPQYSALEYFWRELGELFYDSGNIGRAKFAYSKAITLGGEKSSTHPRLADCYLHEGQYQLALKHYKTYVENSKQVNEQWLLKLDALEDILNIFKVVDLPQRPTKSEKTDVFTQDEFERLIREDIMNINAWFNLGVLFSKNPETHEKAVVCFLWAALHFVSDVVAWANTFILSLSLGEKYLVHAGIVFSAACRIDKGAFVEQVFKSIDDQPEGFDKESLKKLTIQMAQTLVFEEKFELRINGEAFDVDSEKKED